MSSFRLMSRVALSVGVSVLALALAQGALADPDNFFGEWSNIDSHTSGLTHIDIHPGNFGPDVHAFGACHPTDCDWGTAQGHFYGGGRSLEVAFDSAFSVATLRLHESWGQHLTFDMHTHFTDGSGRSDYDMSGELHHFIGWGGAGWSSGGPGPGYGGYAGGPGGYGGAGGQSMGTEDCIAFDPGQVSTAYINGSWKVVQDSTWLLDYGWNSGAAARATHLIHHYHFDQQCFVRRPSAQMMYWKAGGHVPSSGVGGEDCIGLNPMNVTAANVGGDWKVVDGPNWLLDYGSDQPAAQQAAATIQNYRLDRQCFVVRPDAQMMYWLAQ